MTIHREPELRCDYFGVGDFSCDTIHFGRHNQNDQRARQEARSLGWTRRRDQDGRFRDLCPDHSNGGEPR